MCSEVVSGTPAKVCWSHSAPGAGGKSRGDERREAVGNASRADNLLSCGAGQSQRKNEDEKRESAGRSSLLSSVSTPGDKGKSPWAPASPGSSANCPCHGWQLDTGPLQGDLLLPSSREAVAHLDAPPSTQIRCSAETAPSRNDVPREEGTEVPPQGCPTWVPPWQGSGHAQEMLSQQKWPDDELPTWAEMLLGIHLLSTPCSTNSSRTSTLRGERSHQTSPGRYPQSPTPGSCTQLPTSSSSTHPCAGSSWPSNPTSLPREGALSCCPHCASRPAFGIDLEQTGRGMMLCCKGCCPK